MNNKFRKLISTITLGAFFACSYTPVFAATIENEQSSDIVEQQTITEFVVKDPEVKECLESKDSQYKNIPVTLVDEFPAEVEAELDIVYNSIGNANTEENNAADKEERVAIAIALPLAEWLGTAAYVALLAADLILTAQLVGDLVRAIDVEKYIKKDSPDYFVTSFKDNTVYVGGSISKMQATDILEACVKEGHYGTGTFSWRHMGNIMSKDMMRAVLLAEEYKKVTGGVVGQLEPAHGDCGYFSHIHVGKPGADLNLKENHSAHIWFFE